ncbi:MAG: hypothetical protein WD739_11770 [Actinomycetota bacterium]
MEVVIRALVVYVFLILVMRALGKRELTGMTAFDLVLLIVMGDLVQQGITQEDMSLTGAFLAVGRSPCCWPRCPTCSSDGRGSASRRRVPR